MKKVFVFLTLLIFFPFNKPGATKAILPGKVKIGILVNGDACNIDWAKTFSSYEMVNASVRKFLISQYDYNMKERLYRYQPDYCIIYAGLPDILLQVPLNHIANAYQHIANQLINNGIKPVIIKTLPVSKHPAINAKIALLNRRIDEIAVLNEVPCFSSDKNMLINGALDESLTTDGFILNKKGQALFSSNIKAYMDDLIQFESQKQIPKTTRENLLLDGISSILIKSPPRARIVMLGNSITAGGDWNKLLGRSDIRNAGQGGHLSGQMLWLLDTCVISARPELCFIMAGINDLFNRLPISLIHANQVEIIERLKANNIRPIVQSTLYVHGRDELNMQIKEVNNLIEKYCKDNGISYIDLNLSLSDEKGLKAEYTTDGTHLNAIAYQKWAEVLSHFLKTSTKPPVFN